MFHIHTYPLHILHTTIHTKPHTCNTLHIRVPCTTHASLPVSLIPHTPTPHPVWLLSHWARQRRAATGLGSGPGHGPQWRRWGQEACPGGARVCVAAGRLPRHWEMCTRDMGDVWGEAVCAAVRGGVSPAPQSSVECVLLYQFPRHPARREVWGGRARVSWRACDYQAARRVRP